MPDEPNGGTQLVAPLPGVITMCEKKSERRCKRET